MKELLLNVDGMHCGGCENRIQNAISDIKGVASVVADHNSGTVKITLKEDVDRNIFVDLIEDIGFEVKK